MVRTERLAAQRPPQKLATSSSVTVSPLSPSGTGIAERCDVRVLPSWNGSEVRLTSSPSECGLDHLKFPTTP